MGVGSGEGDGDTLGSGVVVGSTEGSGVGVGTNEGVGEAEGDAAGVGDDDAGGAEGWMTVAVILTSLAWVILTVAQYIRAQKKIMRTVLVR